MTYSVKAVLNTGQILDLTRICLSLGWGDQKGAIAQKADITLANVKINEGFIHELIKLCCLIFIYANGEEVFRGVVWEWEYTSAIAKQLSITAYDKMIYMTQSKANSYFSSGMSTKDIIESICAEWSIPLNYSWQSHTHGKLPINNKTISEHITSVLDEAQTKLDSKYTILMEKDTLIIRQQGINSDIFVFHTKNTISTKNCRSLQGLITKVLIVGKSEEDKRPPIIDSLEGKMQYGTLQEIITKDTNKSLDDVKNEAQNIIKENGKPKESISVKSVDVPKMRKGDKVRINAGNLDDYFIVEAVKHNAAEKTMDMELKRYE